VAALFSIFFYPFFFLFSSPTLSTRNPPLYNGPCNLLETPQEVVLFVLAIEDCQLLDASCAAWYRRNQQMNLSAMLNNRFVSSSAIVVMGGFVVNVFNYVFTLLMSRILGLDSFGEVAAMISLLTIISVPSFAFTMLMAREVASRAAGRPSEIHELFIFFRKHAFVIAIAVWILFLALTPFLTRFLHIPYTPFFVFSLIILFLAPGALQVGTLQGLQEFFQLAKQNILGALVKLACALFLVAAGFSVVGVMLALVLAQFATWLYGFLTIRRKLKGAEAPQAAAEKPGFQSLYVSLLITAFLLALISNTDLLLAKHFLSATVAGEYAALSTLGNIIVYSIGAFSTVLLPMASFARASEKGQESRLLFMSLSIIALVVFASAVCFSLFPAFFISVLFGAKYLGIAPVVGRYAFAEGCIALSIALINYFVAVRNTSFLWFVALGIALEAFLISYHHTSVAEIATMFVVAAVGMLALLFLNLFAFCGTVRE